MPRRQEVLSTPCIPSHLSLFVTVAYVSRRQWRYRDFERRSISCSLSLWQSLSSSKTLFSLFDYLSGILNESSAFKCNIPHFHPSYLLNTTTTTTTITILPPIWQSSLNSQSPRARCSDFNSPIYIAFMSASDNRQEIFHFKLID